RPRRFTLFPYTTLFRSVNFAQEWAAKNKVEMQITLVPWKEFMTKITAAIQAQATPDIVESGGVELRALGQLLDVTDVYEKLEKEDRKSTRLNSSHDQIS